MNIRKKQSALLIWVSLLLFASGCNIGATGPTTAPERTSAATNAAETVVDERIELVLLTDRSEYQGYSDRSSLYDLVRDYNSSNRDYRITVIEETTISNSLDYDNLPDIYAYHDRSYGTSGNMENLLPYLDSDPDYERDIFVPSLIRSITLNETMNWLPVDFFLTTFAASENIVGSRTNLTLDEARTYAQELGDGSTVFPGWMVSGIFEWHLNAYASTNIVDENSGVLDRENSDYLAMIQEAENQYGDWNIDTIPPEPPTDPEHLLAFFRIRSLVQYRSVPQSYPDGYSLIGFPVSEGSGNMWNSNLRLGISAESEYKEAAWEFLRSALSDANQAKTVCFPVVRSAFEAVLDAELAKPASDIGAVGIDKLRWMVYGLTQVLPDYETLTN